MQNVEFDIHGNIKPYVVLPLGIDDFKQDFVNAMPYSERRGILFDTFLRHLTDFKTDIDEAFVVWVGGSFVTRKTNPSDIDCVVFLDAECYNRYEERANLLRQERYRPQKLMDVFFVQIYPADHRRRNWYESDRLRWLHDFGTNLAGQKKGIIELNF